jgi:hypothetical protein
VIAVSGKPAAAALGTPRYIGDNTAAKINVVSFISKSLLGILNTLRDIVGTMTLAPPSLLALPLRRFLSSR